MAKVRYSTLAAADLYDNAEYIARDKPDAAYHWVERIEETCERLANNPETGQKHVAMVGAGVLFPGST